MEPDPGSRAPERGNRVAIGRISDAASRWRVVVELWSEDAENCRGRLVFQPDAEPDRYLSREGPPALRGRTPADVMRAAYDLPEEHLRSLLRSLA